MLLSGCGKGEIMSSECKGVGGVGIRVEDYANRFSRDIIFSGLWVKRDYYEAVEHIVVDAKKKGYPVKAGFAGNGLTGSGTSHYLLIDADSMADLLDCYDLFIKWIYVMFGVRLRTTDLKVVVDCTVY